MSRVVVIGAGICGLGTALLLARAGHNVIVFEKDEAPRPATLGACWDGWHRKGVAQFRQPHNFMPGMRLILEADLPDVQAALVEAGASRFDLLHPMPAWLRDSSAQPVDDQLWTYTCRRPTGEWVFLKAVEQDDCIEVRRGVTVTGLTTGPSAREGVPHVTGVQTADGEKIAAELVVDVTGRGSRSGAWLKDIGVEIPGDEGVDCNFTYLTRYFAGAEPERAAPILSEIGSISILTLPGDNGTWSVTIFTSSLDRELRSLRDAGAWIRVIRACPLHAHWIDAEPISDVLAMSGIVDRYQRLAKGGPLVTGFALVADAWACTNPSAGRGMTVGMLHARRLRDCLARSGGDPWRVASEFDEVTERELRPWYDAQIASDRMRFAQMEGSRTGIAPPPSSGPLAQDVRLLRTAMVADGELFRMGLEYISTLTTAQEIMARPGVRERFRDAMKELAHSPPAPIPGPDRRKLVELANA